MAPVPATKQRNNHNNTKVTFNGLLCYHIITLGTKKIELLLITIHL